MIQFKIKQIKNAKMPANGKYFASLVHEIMEFDEFINHMASHHCAFSEATIQGVLIEAFTCLRELVLEGKSVRFGDLGLLSIGIRSKVADKAEDFSTATNIKSMHLNLRLGKRFRADQLLRDAKFSEMGSYTASPTKSRTPKTPTGGSTSGGSTTGGSTTKPGGGSIDA